MDLEPKIKEEYERQSSLLGAEDAGTGTDLSSADILRAHFLIANQFYLEGEGLGGLGPKSVDLLQSATFRQFVQYQGLRKWRTPYERCATLFFGLVKNHPFHDANKRTAFLSALLHLQRNGLCPSVPEQRFEDFTVEVADDQLGKYARYKEYLGDGLGDPEVRYIARFLRDSTRQIDKTHYRVTYRELQTILGRFGYTLDNPNNNHIDILKVERRKQFVVFGREIEVRTRLGQIGFPSWTKEVGESAIKTVRQVTKLDFENGCDSAAFFKGLEPTQILITSYQTQLRNLADR